MKVRTTHVNAASVLSDTYELATDGSKNLTKYGSKISYCGGGWWYVFGYTNTDAIKTKDNLA